MSSTEPKPKFRLRLLSEREWQQRQDEMWRERMSQRTEPSFMGWDAWDERMAALWAEGEPKDPPQGR
jgi:hypothetical protein